MITTVTVVGKLLDRDKNPIVGVMEFLPERLWISEEGEDYATLVATTELDQKGEFSVELTSVESGQHKDWHYKAIIDGVAFKIRPRPGKTRFRDLVEEEINK